MLRSIITATLRNIYRNKTFSLINFFGLAVSMSLGMLIITIVREQHAYDNFHHDVDRIYRVNTKAIRTEGGAELYASAPLPIAKAFMDDYSFAEEVVRIDNQLAGDLEFGDVNVPITGFLTDPSFFTLFNFKLEKGNAATALSNPNSLVLTQAASKKIFGSRETLGQTLTIKGIGEFTVTGVLEEFPSKTHLDFEVLASTSLLPSIEGKGAVMKSVDSWSNYNTGYVYFKIKEGATEKTIVTALTDLVKKNYDSLKIEAKNKGYEFYLQKLTDITPGPELNSQMGARTSIHGV
jgi:putative ABC transport system permease protein